MEREIIAKTPLKSTQRTHFGQCVHTPTLSSAILNELKAYMKSLLKKNVEKKWHLGNLSRGRHSLSRSCGIQGNCACLHYKQQETYTVYQGETSLKHTVILFESVQ